MPIWTHGNLPLCENTEVLAPDTLEFKRTPPTHNNSHVSIVSLLAGTPHTQHTIKQLNARMHTQTPTDKHRTHTNTHILTQVRAHKDRRKQTQAHRHTTDHTQTYTDAHRHERAHTDRQTRARARIEQHTAVTHRKTNLHAHTHAHTPRRSAGSLRGALALVREAVRALVAPSLRLLQAPPAAEADAWARRAATCRRRG